MKIAKLLLAIVVTTNILNSTIVTFALENKSNKEITYTSAYNVTVLKSLGALKVNSVTNNTTTIKGTGTKGAKVTAYVDGKSIGTATVDSNGNYSIKIAKQKAGKEITIKMTKSGYASKSEKIKVLNIFGELKINSVNKNSTKITGVGTKGAKVTAYVDGKSIGTATVDSNGNYSIKIAKQKAGKEITIKMTKSGYASKSEKIKVLNIFGELKINSVNKNSTKITGAGTKGAKVTAYVDGKSIGTVTVDSNGNYSIQIAKQKAGKEITIKMTKSGYASKSEKIKVLNIFGELKINSVNKNSTKITGAGTKGAKVTAYVDGKSIGTVTVDSNGNYSIKIAKQKAGKEITIKMTKSGYASKSEKIKVLNIFGELKINSVNKNSTKITGVGTKGAKVTAYVDGKSIGTATVDSNGNYSIKIAKQKAGKEITIKMTKSGYASKSIKTTVKASNTASKDNYINEMLTIINKERATYGLNPLATTSELNKAAAIRGKELEQSFSHTRPDETVCFTILDEMNIPYLSAGENIAAGQRTVDEVMISWMNSEGHRANILSEGYGKIGITCYEVNGIKYWVQLFTN